MATTSRQVDTGSGSVFLSRLPDLALTRYLPEADVLAAAGEAGWEGRRRVFDPWTTLWGMVGQTLAGGGSQEAAVIRLGACLGRELSPGSGAFCRARQRLPVKVLRRAAGQVSRHAWRFSGRRRGPRRYQLDGFCVALSDTPGNQAVFPQPSEQTVGVGFPVLHVVALVDLDTGCIVALAIGDLKDHDAKLGRALWEVLRPGDLVVADRGFASYGFCVGVARRGAYYVVRQHQRRKNARPLTEKSDEQEETWQRPPRIPGWWDPKQPASLTVRTVRRQMDGGEVLTVNTNLPREGYAAKEVLALYDARWGVETRFLELKVRAGLEPIRAATPELVVKVLWAAVLAYNLVACLLCETAQEAGCDRWSLSFQTALKVLAAAPALATTDAERVGKWVRRQIALNPLPKRRNPHRDEPRVVKQRWRQHKRMVRPREEYREHGRSRAA